MNNKIITNHQLYTFTALSTLGGSILVISSMITGVAKQDAWISVLVTMAAGLILMWLYTYLATRFEGLTLIGLTQKILGRWIGKIIAIGYFLYIFITSYDIPWYIGNFYTIVKQETPTVVILVLFYAALVIGVHYGVETIARVSEVFYLIVTVFFIVMILLVLPEAKFRNVVPVFENGPGPILKAAVILSGYISLQNVTFLMVFPSCIRDKTQGRRSFIGGFLWANTVVLITVFMSILVLGSALIAKSAYPTVLLAREINLGNILTRVEYLISIMWTLSEFTITIMYFYASTLALSELIGLKEHKKIVAPLALLTMMFSLTVNSGAAEKESWIPIGFLPNVITFGFIVPLVMLAVYLVRRATDRSFGPRRR